MTERKFASDAKTGMNEEILKTFLYMEVYLCYTLWDG